MTALEHGPVTGVPIYCPHAGCSWSYDRQGQRGQGFLDVHLRVVHRGQTDPRAAAAQKRDIDRDINSGEIAVDGSAEPKGRDIQMDTSRKVWTRDEILAAIKAWAEAHDGVPPSSSEWMTAQNGYPTTSTVVKYCGKWSTAIADAGFEKPKRGGQAGNKRRSAPKRQKPVPPVSRPTREAPPAGLTFDELAGSIDSLRAEELRLSDLIAAMSLKREALKDIIQTLEEAA